MKGNEEYVQFLNEHPHITVDSKEQYAEQISKLQKKTRKDVLYLLDIGGYGDLNHLVELIETCKNNKFSIKKIDEQHIKSYCEKTISADEMIQDIYQKDRERLTPTYREPPCKISNPDAINKLRGNK